MFLENSQKYLVKNITKHYDMNPFLKKFHFLKIKKSKMIEEFNKELKMIQGKEIKVVKLNSVDGLLETVAA